MKNELPKIAFDNKDYPKSFFEIVKIQDLFSRKLDHDISDYHLVKFYIMLFIYEGEGSHSIDFLDYSYTKGTLLLIRKDQIHKFIKNSAVKGYLLVFTEEFIISHLNRMEASKAMQLFNDSLSFSKMEVYDEEEFKDLTMLIKHLESEYLIKDDFSIGITRSALHILITKLFRTKAKQGHFVDAKKYMSEFLTFQELIEADCFKSRKVMYYAKQLGVSTKTLNNITHSVINISAKAFIDERTIMQVKRLLISTTHSVKEIAYIAGFSDPTNFFKYFKNLTDISPESFRQMH